MAKTLNSEFRGWKPPKIAPCKLSQIFKFKFWGCFILRFQVLYKINHKIASSCDSYLKENNMCIEFNKSYSMLFIVHIQMYLLYWRKIPPPGKSTLGVFLKQGVFSSPFWPDYWHYFPKFLILFLRKL